jgi:hypothetical protein
VVNWRWHLAAAYGELKVAELALTAAKNLPEESLPENQPPPTAAEMLVAAQSRFDAAQEAVDRACPRTSPRTWPLTPLPRSWQRRMVN